MILVGTSLFWEDLEISKDKFFFKRSSRLKISKLKNLFSWKKIYCYGIWMVFVFVQFKSYWIISNYWMNPSHRIRVLKRSIFDVRKNISEKWIESSCNFFFIIYNFILFNQRYSWIINRLVWKKRFDSFPERFIATFNFFVQTTNNFLS